MSDGTGPPPGHHAFITGASRGIGASIAAALAADGARVSLVGRDAAALAEVAAELGGAERALPIIADITAAAAVKQAFAAARRQFGPVSILVNNAGQAAAAKFTDTDEALWNRIIGVNLTGTYLCSREAVPDMLQAGFGRIVNIASIAGLRGAAYISAYATSKHAVIGLTRSLALEFATRNITVNAVCPGYADTDIVKRAIDNIMKKTGRSESEAMATLTATNPQGRLIAPAEVSNAVLWLCRPGTESVTGQSIVIAGGEVTT
ncbi:MAG TPA: SDR family oxidoreductase [Steroidobacteraceae bacterium]|jgi:NAD(P)-dependent dehydrogenase (short-subunit alcohol dehydrogenase family)|nr:SDR family oxidoreductase [Steroidobacteraceae bacterium]